MANFHKYLIKENSTVKQAMIQLNNLASDAILFLVDNQNRLMGSLTDGDLRRGFIEGLTLEAALINFAQTKPKCIIQGSSNLNDILNLRKKLYTILPLVNSQFEVLNVINFKHQKSYLPIDALIMAGGRGERLKPLTDTTPKPMLKVGSKPILEHNIDRLNLFGIDDAWISLRYLGDQIEDYFEDGSKKGMRIQYVKEDSPLGTAGALGLVETFIHDHILLMNSDLLTTIDYEELFLFFLENNADFVVACIPYQVNIPYAVMETDNLQVKGFKEKPTYTHLSNAGIYLMKKEVLSYIPKDECFNATDLMEGLIEDGKSVLAFPFLGYWLDIGKHEDFQKAQQDIQSLKLA
jgi:dTDP-glucose pyrophosphorylase